MRMRYWGGRATACPIIGPTEGADEGASDGLGVAFKLARALPRGSNSDDGEPAAVEGSDRGLPMASSTLALALTLPARTGTGTGNGSGSGSGSRADPRRGCDCASGGSTTAAVCGPEAAVLLSEGEVRAVSVHVWKGISA
jgi:hypothetical protein